MTDADKALVARIRTLMKRCKGCTEQKMFGAVCFMINKNMCVGPWKGSLIVRLNKAEHDQIQAEPFVKPMDITGKVMKGWARIEAEGISSDEELQAWIDRAVRFVRTLPPK